MLCIECRQNVLHMRLFLCWTKTETVVILDVSHTHTRLTAFCPGLPGWAGTRKVKPIWILLEQETVSGSGISWAIGKSAPRSRQITAPAPHYSSFFTGRMPFLPPNQQCQSTEGMILTVSVDGKTAYLYNIPIWAPYKKN